jgi:uncharacterized membrane protein YqaE (UPF0057 family)
MIYVLAFFLPPLALLLNGQVFAAIFNAVLFVTFLVLGLLTVWFMGPWLWLVAPAHAVIAIYMRNVRTANTANWSRRSSGTARRRTGGRNICRYFGARAEARAPSAATRRCAR